MLDKKDIKFITCTTNSRRVPLPTDVMITLNRSPLDHKEFHNMQVAKPRIKIIPTDLDEVISFIHDMKFTDPTMRNDLINLVKENEDLEVHSDEIRNLKHQNQ